MSAPALTEAPPCLTPEEWCDIQGIDHVRLQGVLEWVTKNPQLHDQSTWGCQTDCGTTACLAGWTVLLAGEDLDWSNPGGAFTARSEWTSVRAAALLGIDEPDADWLFSADNTVADLWDIAEEITRGAVCRPAPTP